MREVWEEIRLGIGLKTFLITLLSIALILFGALCLARFFSLRENAKLQEESITPFLFINLLQQTLHRD